MMIREYYDLAEQYIKAYGITKEMIKEKREELICISNIAFKEGGREITNKNHTEEKICELADLDNIFKNRFSDIIEAEEMLEPRFKIIMVESIAKNKAVSPRLGIKDFSKAKVNFIEKVALRLIGKDLVKAMKDKESESVEK